MAIWLKHATWAHERYNCDEHNQGNPINELIATMALFGPGTGLALAEGGDGSTWSHDYAAGAERQLFGPAEPER